MENFIDHKSRQKLLLLSNYLVLVLLACVFLFPLIWPLLNSVKSPAEAVAIPQSYFPSTITLDNYAELETYANGATQHATNSLIVATITVIGTIILSTLGGYGFARFSFKGKNLLFVMILITLMIPFQSILIPLFVMLSKVNLDNTLFGLALVYITFQLPFGIFIMRNSFEVIPIEIEEAALLDGCNSVTLLYRVMLRLVLPGIVTTAIYAFINAWNEFLAALIFMTDDSKYTLPIFLTNVRSGRFGQIDWGALQAGITVAIIPCIVLFILLQRYYISGLIGGSVKS
jgi:multiple sugar transport system permease protein